MDRLGGSKKIYHLPQKWAHGLGIAWPKVTFLCFTRFPWDLLGTALDLQVVRHLLWDWSGHQKCENQGKGWKGKRENHYESTWMNSCLLFANINLHPQTWKTSSICWCSFCTGYGCEGGSSRGGNSFGLWELPVSSWAHWGHWVGGGWRVDELTELNSSGFPRKKGSFWRDVFMIVGKLGHMRTD